jgi:hypothetical protein
MVRFTLSKSIVIAGLILVLALFAEEALHLHRYDRKGEPHVMRAAAKAGCTPLQGSPGYAWCIVPGFGKALYRCTQRECGFQEPSAIHISPQEMEKEQADWESMFPIDEKDR